MKIIHRRRSHCAKISNNNQRQIASRISRARKEFPLGSCNGFVLCGIPYRGWMSLRFLSALRTGIPLPHSGQATKATGRLHCYICNFLRVAQATLMCNSRIALFLAPFRDFLRIPTTLPYRNPPNLWKGSHSCGKAPHTRSRSGQMLSRLPESNRMLTCAAR